MDKNKLNPVLAACCLTTERINEPQDVFGLVVAHSRLCWTHDQMCLGWGLYEVRRVSRVTAGGSICAHMSPEPPQKPPQLLSKPVSQGWWPPRLDNPLGYAHVTTSSCWTLCDLKVIPYQPMTVHMTSQHTTRAVKHSEHVYGTV